MFLDNASKTLHISAALQQLVFHITEATVSYTSTLDEQGITQARASHCVEKYPVLQSLLHRKPEVV